MGSSLSLDWPHMAEFAVFGLVLLLVLVGILMRNM
jgi:hypothetical protein